MKTKTTELLKSKSERVSDWAKRLFAVSALFVINTFQSGSLVFGQSKGKGDISFDEVTTQINGFMGAIKTVINVIGGAFALFFIIRIAMAYWGGGEDGRQEAGGMIKKFLMGVIIWISAFALIDGIFDTTFAKQ